MKFRLVGVDEDDKLRYHLGDELYSACPEETIPFLQVNSFSYSLRQTLLPKEKLLPFSSLPFPPYPDGRESIRLFLILFKSAF
jgi:hypothetical protein